MVEVDYQSINGEPGQRLDEGTVKAPPGSVTNLVARLGMIEGALTAQLDHVGLMGECLAEVTGCERPLITTGASIAGHERTRIDIDFEQIGDRRAEVVARRSRARVLPIENHKRMLRSAADVVGTDIKMADAAGSIGQAE